MLRRLGHGVGKAIVGERLVAEQPGAFGAERHHLRNDRAVVGGAVLLAAAEPCLEGALAQVAARRELQERLDRRAPERDDVLAGEPPLAGGLGGCPANAVGQAGKVRLAVEDKRERALVGKNVLAELSAEGGQPLADLGEPLLSVLVQRGAGAHEREADAFQHAGISSPCSCSASRRAPQVLDAGEQRRVQIDPVAVAPASLGAISRSIASSASLLSTPTR